MLRHFRLRSCPDLRNTAASSARPSTPRGSLGLSGWREKESSADAADSRFLRWNERTQQQIGFLNNLPIALGAGLIGLTLAHNPTPNDSWRNVLTGAAIIVVAISVACGLFVAATRLRSIRMTASRNRLTYLRRKLLDEDDTSRRRNDLERLFSRWQQWTQIRTSRRSRDLRSAVNQCLGSLQGQGIDQAVHRAARDANIKAKEWERGPDSWTWRLLWLSFIFFGSGAVMLAVVPILENLVR